jgi:hypothetical protein
MLKLGAKRRRTTAEVERDKALMAGKEEAVQQQLEQYNALLKENEMLKVKEQSLDNMQEMIHQLEQRDIIQLDSNNTFKLSEDAIRISKQKH